MLKSRRFWYLIATVVFGGAVLLGWWWTRPPRLNVLIITLDTTRADHLGCYGDSQAETPVLDGLADRGLLFEHAYATAPLTLPSHASLFTGLYPPEHGLLTNGKSRLDDEVSTLAEILLSKGYETGAFVASFVLDSKFGLDQGFQTYGDDLTGTDPADEALHRHRSGDRVVDEALEWLTGHSRQPFLCWVHLYDPHTPYREHQEIFGDRFRGRPYDAEIAFADQQVGRLLEFLQTQQLDDRTVVVVVGDHGEGLGDHQERRHGQMLYNSTMQVPLILAGADGVTAGSRVSDPVSQIDLLPTLLAILNLGTDHPISGRSLIQVASDKEEQPRLLYGATDEPLLESGWSPLRSLTGARWKYIRTTHPELYDLASDPDELNNLAEKQSDLTAEFEEKLIEFESRMRRRSGADVHLSPAEQRALASLGYAGSSGEDGPTTESLPDIKNMIGHYNALEDARTLLETGQLDEAERALKKIVSAAPAYELAEISLGDACFQQRKLDEALSIYQRVLQKNPDCALAEMHIGDIREAQGRYADALQHYLKTLTLEPDSAKLHYNLGRILVLLGRIPEAKEHFKTALEIDPGFVFAHIELGTALVREARPQEALAQYRLALQYDANSLHAHMNLAMLQMKQGRRGEALEHLKQSARISPDDAEVRLQLGAALAAAGDIDEAIVHLAESARLRPTDPRAGELLQKIQRPRK